MEINFNTHDEITLAFFSPLKVPSSLIKGINYYYFANSYLTFFIIAVPNADLIMTVLTRSGQRRANEQQDMVKWIFVISRNIYLDLHIFNYMADPTR